ncbi:MAG: hypothetical protein K2Y37_27105, partial [Pirellulales bacterium]|nr:hypothetical protein [Pirellulales bacterium]
DLVPEPTEEFYATITTANVTTTDWQGTCQITDNDADMQIFIPRVVNTSEPVVADAEEVTIGSVTFVNLDNDDRDGTFDYGGANQDTSVVGGDDELVKIKLIVPNNTPGTATLTATAGAGSIQVWTQSDKGSQYALGTPIAAPGAGWIAEGDTLVRYLWVEGIAPHTTQQETKLRFTFDAPGRPVATDDVSLTVIGVQSVSWEGVGNSLTGNNTLDADPKWPTTLAPTAVRVFPDARMDAQGNVSQARDHVLAKVELTVAPPRPITVYVHSFDVDDPSAESDAVDSETTPDDNRSTGYFAAGGADRETIDFPASATQRTQTAQFFVSKKPGDNFRLVANGDRDFLDDLENDDSSQGGAATQIARNEDRQRIINHFVSSTTLADREVRSAANYASNTLTVWRFLTVEFDSYPQIQQLGVDSNANQLSGTIVDFVGTGTALTELITQDSLDDGSPDLSGPVVGNGRFENGTIYLGDPGPNPRMSIGPITGNGDNNFVFPAASIAGIGFTGQDTTAPAPQTIGGTITQVTKTSSTSYTWTLNVTSAPPTNWNALVDGKLSVGSPDQWMTITAVNAAQSQVTTSSFRLHFSAADDDDLSLLPFPVNGLDPIFVRAYEQAYVESVLSLIGNAVLTSGTLPLNLDPADLGIIEDSQLKARRGANFWAAYNIWVWQFYSGQDTDPNPENLLNAGIVLGSGRGYTLDSQWSGVALETTRDTFINGPWSASWLGYGYRNYLDLLWRVTAHEVGHQFDLVDTGQYDLMGKAEHSTATTLVFRAEDLASIRDRNTSPGD